MSTVTTPSAHRAGKSTALKEYRKGIWRKAVADAESDVMRACPSLVGGRKEKETVEEYAARCTQMLREALSKYRHARVQLEKFS